MPNRDSSTIENAIRALGELLLPGTSQFLDGELKSGTLHAVGGLVAKAAFGPVGWLAFGLNSYSSSVTGRSAYRHLTESLREGKSASKKSSTKHTSKEEAAKTSAPAVKSTRKVGRKRRTAPKTPKD